MFPGTLVSVCREYWMWWIDMRWCFYLSLRFKYRRVIDIPRVLEELAGYDSLEHVVDYKYFAQTGANS